MEEDLPEKEENQEANLCSMAAVWARVAVACGESVDALVPVIIPWPIAHRMAVTA